MTKTYRGDVLTTGGPSYESNVTRFAYVFKYATAHADYLNTIITQSRRLSAALIQERVDIACIGGGPGSDVLGFLKFLLSQETKPQVTFFILDREAAWGDTWADLDTIVSAEMKTSRNYFPIDVTDPKSYEKFNRPFRSHIFKMLYFLSEVYRHKGDVSKFLELCFRRMTTNALLVVLDFHHSELESWIDSCAKNSGLKTLRADDDYRIFMDSIEDKSALGKYRTKFGEPKLQAKVFIRVFMKT